MRDPIVNIAVKAARAAGNTILRALDRLDSIRISEKKPNDFVTEIDQLVEQEITAIIRKAYPNHGIIGEEGGEISGRDYQWIIDPIDGTRNFMRGFPYFAVSIGIMQKGRLEHGVIYEPIRQELFTATRGKGARLNEHRIRVSKCPKLEQAVIGTNYPHRNTETYFVAHQAVVDNCSDVRIGGAACLDLAYLACGRLDGFWQLGLKLWDMAAGLLLVKEAGGIVCDIHGGEDYLKTGHVVCANPKVLKELLKVVKPCLGDIS